MPPLRPMPPSGLFTCAASPAIIMRPLHIGRGHALVHPVGGAMRHFVRLAARHGALQQPLGALRRRDVFVVERGIDRKQRPPDARRPDQHVPFARIRQIGDVREVRHRFAEIVGRRQRQEQLGNRDAVERGADRMTHHAADPVGPDQKRPRSWSRCCRPAARRRARRRRRSAAPRRPWCRAGWSPADCPTAAHKAVSPRRHCSHCRRYG